MPANSDGSTLYSEKEIERLENALEGYFEAAAGASDRSRRVIIAIVTACVFIFSAVWNSMDWGWQKQRLRCFRDAISFFEEQESQKQRASENESSQNCTSRNNQNTLCKNISDLFPIAFPANSPAQRCILIGENGQSGVNGDRTNSCAAYQSGTKAVEKKASDDVDHGKKCADNYIISSLADAKEQYQFRHEDFLKNNLNIKLPFFGVAFDVNDTSLIGGFTLIVILLWMRFSTWHEYINLVRLFLSAEDLDNKSSTSPSQVSFQKIYYRKLSMRQVFTLTGYITKPDEKLNIEQKVVLWRNIARFLHVLPLLTMGVAVVHDITTYQVGILLAPLHSIIHFSVSFGLLVIISLITWNILEIIIRVDKYWDELVKRLQDVEKIFSSGTRQEQPQVDSPTA